VARRAVHAHRPLDAAEPQIARRRARDTDRQERIVGIAQQTESLDVLEKRARGLRILERAQHRERQHLGPLREVEQHFLLGRGETLAIDRRRDDGRAGRYSGERGRATFERFLPGRLCDGRLVERAPKRSDLVVERSAHAVQATERAVALERPPRIEGQILAERLLLGGIEALRGEDERAERMESRLPLFREILDRRLALVLEKLPRPHETAFAAAQRRGHRRAQIVGTSKRR
jgi:hypothetical protein